MSFRKNPAQQMSLFDTTYNLTEREKKALLTMPVKRTDHKGRRLREGESQRKNLLYQFRYTDENGKRRTIYASDLKELREKEAAIKKDREDGIRFSGGQITVTELAERYIDLKF